MYLGKSSLVGFYVAPAADFCAVSKKIGENVKTECIIMYELSKYSFIFRFDMIGRLCTMLQMGNPNIVWTLFNNPLFQTKSWQELCQFGKEDFMTQRVVLQSIGFVKNELNMIKKKKEPFNFEKAFPAVACLQICLSKYLNIDLPQPDVHMELSQALDLSTQVMNTAISSKLADSPLIPRSAKTENLKLWSTTVRKLYWNVTT